MSCVRVCHVSCATKESPSLPRSWRVCIPFVTIVFSNIPKTIGIALVRIVASRVNYDVVIASTVFLMVYTFVSSISERMRRSRGL